MPKKSLVFAVCLATIAILSFLGWSNLNEILFNGSGVAVIVSTAGIFLLLLAIFAVLVLIFDSWKMMVPAAAVILLVYIFVFGYHWAYLAVFVAGLGLTLAGILEAKKIKTGQIKIQPKQITRPARRAMFMALALATAMAIYFSPQAQKLFSEIRIPRPLFDLVIDSMSGFLESQIDSQFKASAPISIAIPGMEAITINDFNKAIGRNNVRATEIIDQKTKDSFYQAINEQIMIILEPYKRFSPYVLAAAAFFSLNAIGFIFVWLAGILSSVIFLLLKALKVVNVGKEMVEREIIEI